MERKGSGRKRRKCKRKRNKEGGDKWWEGREETGVSSYVVKRGLRGKGEQVCKMEGRMKRGRS